MSECTNENTVYPEGFTFMAASLMDPTCRVFQVLKPVEYEMIPVYDEETGEQAVDEETGAPIFMQGPEKQREWDEAATQAAYEAANPA